MFNNLSKEEVVLFAQSYYGVFMAALFCVTITLLTTKARRKVSGESKCEISGKLGLPFIGETLSFLSATNSYKGCYDFVSHRRQRYGKWFKTRIFGAIHVFVPTTEGAKMIFENEFVQFNKGYIKSMGDAVGAKSVLCVPHENHRRIRRILSESLSLNSLSVFVEKFDIMLCKKLMRLEQDGKSFSVLEFCMKLTFEAMSNMLMSITDESLLKQIERECTDVSNAMLSFPFMIPGTRYYKGIKARERLLKMFEEMIADRRSGKESGHDFLQTMIQKDSCDPCEKLEDSEIMDNLLTMIIAGQTTTAAAMMWSVKFLDENKELQERLREEQLALIQTKPAGSSVTMEDLNSMSFGLKVVKETLRMSNVLLWFPRVALNDCKIQGYEIKKGWHVNIDATQVHYDPALYKNPMQFNPSRFDEFQKPYTFIPFGYGPRTCLGINMAKVTMLVFLHRLTSGYKWTVDDLDPRLEKKSHIPRLKSGCPITLKAF